jgi:hypothetical protein
MASGRKPDDVRPVDALDALMGAYDGDVVDTNPATRLKGRLPSRRGN